MVYVVSDFNRNLFEKLFASPYCCQTKTNIDIDIGQQYIDLYAWSNKSGKPKGSSSYRRFEVKYQLVTKAICQMVPETQIFLKTGLMELP